MLVSPAQFAPFHADSCLMPQQVNRMCSLRSRFREHGRMRSGTSLVGSEADDTTTASLRLMLSYVEAECLRIGAADAAKHAALAAALVPGSEADVIAED